MAWIDEDTFSFWMPAQAVIVKGGKKDGADSEGRRWIQGIASTSDRDLQGEIVDQNGIDFSYFLQHGYFNNDHKPGFENKVGEPTEAKITKNGLWVKGFLYNGHKIADSIWELIHAQNKSNSRRRIGFSIQGKVKRRDGSKIKECWIQDIAVTPCPVNTSTWAEIAKSLSAQTWDFEKSNTPNNIPPGNATNVAANVAVNAEEEEEKKALSADSVLVPESLDSIQRKDLNKSLTFEEAVEFVMKSTGLSRDNAETTTRVIFSHISRSE